MKFIALQVCITLSLFLVVFCQTPLPINQATIVTPQNTERNNYGVANFIIDDKLASVAQSETNTCEWNAIVKEDLQKAYANAKGESYTGATSQTLGLNLAAATGAAVTPNWMSQKSKWNCLANSCSTGNAQDCYGYTQSIWEASTTLGCAITNCSGNLLGGTYWYYLLCLYSIAGNFAGEHPLGSNYAQQCVGTPSPSGSPSPSTVPSPSPKTPSPSPSGGTPSTNPSPSGGTPSTNPSPSGGTPSTNPSPSGGTPSTNPSPSGGTPSTNPSPSGGTPSTNPSPSGNPSSNPVPSPSTKTPSPGGTPSTNPSPSGGTPSTNPSPSGGTPSTNPSPSGGPPSTNPSPSGGTPSTNPSPSGGTPSTNPSGNPSPSGTNTPNPSSNSPSPSDGVNNSGDTGNMPTIGGLPIWAIVLIGIAILIVIIVIIVIIVVVASKAGAEVV